MDIFIGSTAAENQISASVFALGNFDGVHLAHQALFDLAKDLARNLCAKAGVYTFYPHPAEFFAPQSHPALLQTLDQKIETIADLKMSALVLEPFSERFANQSPEDFFKEVLVAKLHVKGLVAGDDFTFGKGRLGNIERLRRLCDQHAVDLRVLDPFYSDGLRVSSTLIRNFIRKGELLKAAHFLTRPLQTQVTPKTGAGLGQKLGFPTLNLEPASTLMPRFGVYATRLSVFKKNLTLEKKSDLFSSRSKSKIIFDADEKQRLASYAGVTNWGTRPTLNDLTPRPVLETHLLDFKGDLPLGDLRIEWIDFIREEKKFNSLSDLSHAIQKDVEVGRRILET